jgi:hypothetical protein
MMTAEEYDRSNAVIGVARFLGIALDLTLSREEREELAGVESGSFLTGLIEHLKTNSLTMYRETQLMNPYMSTARKRLIEDLKKIDKEMDGCIFGFRAYPCERWW